MFQTGRSIAFQTDFSIPIVVYILGKYIEVI